MLYRLSWLSLVLLVAVSAAAPASVRYEVIDLGSGTAKAISDQNHVAGYYPQSGIPGPFGYPVTRQRGFYWSADSGRVQFSRSGIPYPYDLDLHGWDINNSGHIAVHEVGAYARSWVYHGPTQMPYGDLATFGEPGITDGFLLVGSEGYEQLPSSLWRYRAKGRRGTGGVFNLVPPVPFDTRSHYVMAVNNAEVVVAQNGVWRDSAVALLPGPGETWGYVGLEGAEADGSGWRNVLGLNDQFGVSLSGVAVGQAASTTHGSAKVACYWDNQFDCHVIGRLGASGESQANATNSARQMVGTSQSGGSAYKGFVYFDGVMENINDLLAPGSPAITIEELHDINTAGWMVGRASTGAVLLRPRYLDDRDFQLNDLTVHWTVNGSGTTRETEPGEYCAVLTAESPTSISQEVATPVAVFQLEFDYRFLTDDPTAVLTIELEGTSLTELHAPDPAMSSWDSHSVLVTDPALQNLDAATLSFIYDGPKGSELLLDNIGINQVPEPTALALQGVALLGLVFFSFRRNR